MSVTSVYILPEWMIATGDGWDRRGLEGSRCARWQLCRFAAGGSPPGVGQVAAGSGMGETRRPVYRIGHSSQINPTYPGLAINPRLVAMAIASVRPMASNLARIDLTWALTVFSLI